MDDRWKWIPVQTPVSPPPQTSDTACPTGTRLVNGACVPFMADDSGYELPGVPGNGYTPAENSIDTGGTKGGIPPVVILGGIAAAAAFLFLR